MIGESPRHTARRGNDIDVDVSVVFTLKGNPVPVRRKDRIGFVADAIGEAVGLAAVARYAPKIACVREDNLCFAKRGISHQQWLSGRLSKTESGHDVQKSEKQNSVFHTWYS